jgi:hypothetical protein
MVAQVKKIARKAAQLAKPLENKPPGQSRVARRPISSATRPRLKAFKLQLRFTKSRVERDGVIAVLQNIVDALLTQA